MSGPRAAADDPPGRLDTSGYLVPFTLIHAGALAALLDGISVARVALFLCVFFVQAFGITAGYHRYFSHRSFKTSRAFQLALAVLGTLAVQKGVLWWSANHRRHHRFADAAGDPHSPRDGLAWAHLGWFLSSEFTSTDHRAVRDLDRFAELRWLDEHFVLPPLVFATLLTIAFGIPGLLWGFFLPTTVVWHLTYAVNSLGHRCGTRRFETTDASRNSFALALLTLGEGWHNNHHRFPTAARQGMLWWEIDLTYYALRILAGLGIVWELIDPPGAAEGRSPSA